MKFFRDRSLKQLSTYGLLLMALIFVSEYFGMRYQIHSLEESERKIDFTRTIQIGMQQIALESFRSIQSSTPLASEVSNKIDNLEHQMATLADGGRIDGTEFFIPPLSRLSRITFDNLQKKWAGYKQSVLGFTVTSEDAPFETASAGVPASVLHDAGWLSLSGWFDRLVDDLEDEVSYRQQAVFLWAALFTIIDIMLLAALWFGFQKIVVRPMLQLRESVINHSHTEAFRKNEIGKVTQEVNGVIENLKDATDFVVAIGEGNLNISYKETLDGQYVPGKNKLADSLIQMQEKLTAMNEAEARRQWANEGITKFVEIMRSSNDNLSSLGDAVISSLVQYTKSNQGALYILNDEDQSNKYLELISLFAFDAKKYEQRKIKLGEGILGQTFLEKETTHLTNMPQEYIRITSGLGDANPTALLLFPLKIDKEAYGIIELASFRAFESHEIEFVEKLGESIAATLGSVRAAQKNRQLIEQFQQQTEQMRAQEEEMRQNMEELQATQEEVARKEQAYLERIKELETNVHGSDGEEIDLLREKAARTERDLRSKIEELTQQHNTLQLRSDDWAIAEEVEKALKTSLEAIKITQDELNRKAGR